MDVYFWTDGTVILKTETTGNAMFAFTLIPACYVKQFHVSQYFFKGLLIWHFLFFIAFCCDFHQYFFLFASMNLPPADKIPAYVECIPGHNQVRKLVIIKKDLFLESIKTFTYFTV